MGVVEQLLLWGWWEVLRSSGQVDLRSADLHILELLGVSIYACVVVSEE